MTGITIFEPEIGGKWLQVLKEIAPTSRRAAVIFNPDTAPYYPLYMRSIEAAAATLDMKVFEAPVHNHADIEATLRGLARQHPPGVLWASATANHLKTEERKIHLEIGLGGNSPRNQPGWDENRVFLEGDKLEVAVVKGRRVLTAVPSKPSAPKPVQHYFPAD
jgi:hypothetical protein